MIRRWWKFVIAGMALAWIPSTLLTNALRQQEGLSPPPLSPELLFFKILFFPLDPINLVMIVIFTVLAKKIYEWHLVQRARYEADRDHVETK